ncbi:hypothetical protein GQR58_001391 [Nymphon striatum]|nr:hypothetical protein GQR58_001391 [Nymphon striatum]
MESPCLNFINGHFTSRWTEILTVHKKRTINQKIKKNRLANKTCVKKILTFTRHEDAISVQGECFSVRTTSHASELYFSHCSQESVYLAGTPVYHIVLFIMARPMQATAFARILGRKRGKLQLVLCEKETKKISHPCLIKKDWQKFSIQVECLNEGVSRNRYLQPYSSSNSEVSFLTCIGYSSPLHGTSINYRVTIDSIAHVIGVLICTVGFNEPPIHLMLIRSIINGKTKCEVNFGLPLEIVQSSAGKTSKFSVKSGKEMNNEITIHSVISIVWEKTRTKIMLAFEIRVVAQVECKNMTKWRIIPSTDLVDKPCFLTGKHILFILAKSTIRPFHNDVCDRQRLKN